MDALVGLAVVFGFTVLIVILGWLITRSGGSADVRTI
jgi:hypothetical protein